VNEGKGSHCQAEGRVGWGRPQRQMLGDLRSISGARSGDRSTTGRGERRVGHAAYNRERVALTRGAGWCTKESVGKVGLV